ncbi:CHAT domain-containing protein [Nostoc sp. PCC 9305]|uniref:CHAT domain-containing tetratricopeptide repeat protein n=1 Tax=Nostoc sp. PCC 9305 TaxID=296636 RepID=UPI0039C74AC2
MNEQRQQAYLNLIQRLLNCPANDEFQETLAANQELVDIGFLQTIKAVAQTFSQQRDENTANWLRNLAMQLGEALNLDNKVDLQSLSEEKKQAYLQLLMQLLQVTAKSKGDVRVIYPLLAKNTDKLDGVFAEILRRWGTNKLIEVQADEAKYIAGVIYEFSNLMAVLPLVNKASNIEIAITGYEVVLIVYTKEALPQNWAMTQNNLANAYRERIKGDKANNIEKVIAAFTAALTVYTREALPQNWAATQNNLANAYWERIKGDKANNIEKVIAAFTAALTVYTREALPQNWAAAQNNLATAYSVRIKGDKADNIEQAIAASTAALTVFTREALPVDWAAAQNNLATAYSVRIKGDKADNIEQAIAAYTAALTVRTREALPQNWAATQHNLATAYSDRIKGDKADNIEQAIAAFTAVLTVYTREALPQNWAMTQDNLATAYRDRIKGDKADNIEKAIASYTAALTVRTKEALPVDWAATQNNLANAYRDRIKGDKADNIEQAIAASTAALTVYTREALPQNWAATQNNLGLAYSDRIKGDKADNIEQAIASYTAALTVYTREALPVDWAMTQSNLAIAYKNRIKGDKADNIEQAIASYTAALTVYTKEALPQNWAATQHNLANAYRDRIKRDKVDNIEKAIAAYNAALTVHTREALPQNWAMTQNNLAIAYKNRIKGDKANNIEQAIAAFTAALTVYTKEALPVDWAATQNNLAIAYRDRIKGDKVDNIEQAIASYTAALTVYTRDALPVDWAAAQNNLAAAYSVRIKGDKADNIEKAIAAFIAALTVYTREALPEDHAEILFGLGINYQDANKFDLAYNTFKSSIDTVESLREEIISGEESKRKQAENFNKVYSCMVKVCLQLDNITEAIEYVERSKTRSLVEQILERDAKTIFPPDVVTQLETYRDEIAAGQYQIQNGKAENPQDLAERLQELRQQRNNLQDQYLPIGSSFKFDKFPETLDANTAVIEWYIATDTILTFIIKPHGQQLVYWQSTTAELNALFNWNNEYLNDYYNPEDENKIQWQNQLETRLNKLAEILHIEEILAHIPEQCQRLILIPHRFLHLFPLHALPIKSSYLIDLFPKGVSYAPSCQILQQVQLRQHPESQSLLKSLFAVQNPTADLYQDYEKDLGAVAAIKKKFTQAHIIKKAKANKSAILHVDENHHTTLNPELRQANNIFFFCHGYFNPNSPQDSGLQLADANLTLTEIIAHFKLANCHLVTLSACETGMIDSRNTSDEYIGLPSGFLLAGSTNVVSSLWTVSATATALFMMKFYEELQQQTNIVLALNAAQRWLRNTTTKGFQDWLPKSSLRLDCQIGIYKHLTEIAKDKGESTPPFESPFYWAAFYHTGKGV